MKVSNEGRFGVELEMFWNRLSSLRWTYVMQTWLSHVNLSLLSFNFYYWLMDGPKKKKSDWWSSWLILFLSCYSASQIDENVKREIINHRSLRHPNIVRFREVSMFLQFHLVCVQGSGSYILLSFCLNFHPGHFNTNSSSHCYGICIWRRALWSNLQGRAFFWGWGFYAIWLLFLVSFIP